MNARSTLSTPSGNEGSRRGYSCKNNGGGGAEDVSGTHTREYF